MLGRGCAVAGQGMGRWPSACHRGGGACCFRPRAFPGPAYCRDHRATFESWSCGWYTADRGPVRDPTGRATGRKSTPLCVGLSMRAILRLCPAAAHPGCSGRVPLPGDGHRVPGGGGPPGGQLQEQRRVPLSDAQASHVMRSPPPCFPMPPCFALQLSPGMPAWPSCWPRYGAAAGIPHPSRRHARSHAERARADAGDQLG